MSIPFLTLLTLKNPFLYEYTKRVFVLYALLLFELKLPLFELKLPFFDVEKLFLEGYTLL